jgi:ATP-dependent DNA helicase RecG
VVFGVTPAGELVGQEIGTNTLEQVAAAIREITPAVLPDMDVVPVGDQRHAIVLTVPGGGGPYSHRSRPFIRLGPTTSAMPQDMFEIKIAEKLHNSIRWENQPVPDGITTAHLDEDEILRTVSTAQNLGRLGNVSTDNVSDILTGLELLVDGKLVNAAIALYARDRQGLFARYPQLEVRLGRFRGKDRLADFADNRDYWGGIFTLLRRAEDFLRDHVHIAGRVVPGKMQREDYPDYPPRATREALANAFCHRDYTMAGGAVEVAMYDDHLEITNPGEFHFGITPDALRGPHASRPWNPIIASVLHRAGVIERWGSGTLNVIDWCREGHTPEPTWGADTRTVTVTFLPGSMPEVTPPVTPPVAPPVAPPVFTLLELLGREGPMGAAAIRAQLGLRDRTHVRETYVNPALTAGLIEMTIPERPTSRLQKYRLTQTGKAVLAASPGQEGGPDA